MASKKTAFWVIGGIAISGIALYMLVFRKKTLSNTGPSLSLAKPSPGSGSSSGSGGSGNVSAPKTQVYLVANGFDIRSSPHVNDGLLGTWFTNLAGSATGAGSYVGSLISSVPDSDGAVNPATGRPYIWYNVSLSPGILVTSADAYYIREDGVTLK